MSSLQRDLKWLGLWKFAGAVMYVLHEVFGLSEDKMIAPMNAKEGRFLLDEIMRGGNFGQYDDRFGDKVGEGKVHRYFRMSLRNMRFVKHYPSEALCEPLFRTWFWGWKKFYSTWFAQSLDKIGCTSTIKINELILYCLRFAQSLDKIGCTSAIEASFIALGLRNLCVKIRKESWRCEGKNVFL